MTTEHASPAELEESSVREGYLVDFISGTQVPATPEETEAVQVFAKRLVEDFGYPKSVITTRPQFRVRRRPSEKGTRGYPVDIAVFSSDRKLEEDAWLLVECKRKTRQDGEAQLKTYLTLSPAQLGVWFNGIDHLYLAKNYKPDGSLEWRELPSIPKWGQPLAEIGSLRRKELTTPSNLRAVFRDIRNHLAGNTTGITRDQSLAEEIIALLFCKIYDEIDTAPDDMPEFRVGFDESPRTVAERLSQLFEKVKAQYDDVFSSDDHISLDVDSLYYVVGELQNYAVVEAPRDAIGDAFEVFIGPAVRGEEGQFFTPRNVVQLMIDLIGPSASERIIDPACGSGGFLVVALEHIWKHLEEEGSAKKWSPELLERRKRDAAMHAIRGVDKDSFLAKVTKAYMAIIGDGRGGIFCQDSLAQLSTWDDQAKSQIALGTFDVVVTNPPFGSKIKVTGTAKLGQYELGRRWKQPRPPQEDWTITSNVLTEQAPQVLFIERCVQLLKPGGRLAIILPESIFGMSNYGYVVQYLYENFRLRAFVSLPEEVFQPYTHAKTCVLVLENSPPGPDDEIEMAIADWCGHDSRGKPTLRLLDDETEVILDDLPLIAEQLSRKMPWNQTPEPI